jgi:hypothetical protein
MDTFHFPGDREFLDRAKAERKAAGLTDGPIRRCPPFARLTSLVAQASGRPAAEAAAILAEADKDLRALEVAALAARLILADARRQLGDGQGQGQKGTGR